MSKARRLRLVLLLNLLLVAALIVVGVAPHSLGVLAAGVDYLADVRCPSCRHRGRCPGSPVR